MYAAVEIKVTVHYASDLFDKVLIKSQIDEEGADGQPAG